jgi:hypothetical protein
MQAEHNRETHDTLRPVGMLIVTRLKETSGATYRRRDGQPFEKPGAGQLIFSDLGTLSVEASRGFSAYRWIRNELVRLGVPPSEIAYMQDHKKSEAKQRLFNDFNAGKVRFSARPTRWEPASTCSFV